MVSDATNGAVRARAIVAVVAFLVVGIVLWLGWNGASAGDAAGPGDVDLRAGDAAQQSPERDAAAQTSRRTPRPVERPAARRHATGAADAGKWRCRDASPVGDQVRWRASTCARAAGGHLIVVVATDASERGYLEAAVRAVDGLGRFVTIAACSTTQTGDSDETWRSCLAAAPRAAGRRLLLAAGRDAALLLSLAQRGRLPGTLIAVSPGGRAPAPHRDLASAAVVLASPQSPAWSRAEAWRPHGARVVPVAGDVVVGSDLTGWLQALIAR